MSTDTYMQLGVVDRGLVRSGYTVIYCDSNLIDHELAFA